MITIRQRTKNIAHPQKLLTGRNAGFGERCRLRETGDAREICALHEFADCGKGWL